MYRFKNSVAYYEILLFDTPRIEYNKKNKVEADDESIRLNEESLIKARAKREKEKIKYEDL